MNKIIFFDIDGTLFDVPLFIKLLHKNLIDRFGLSEQDILELRTLYDETKKEEGYFLPKAFFNKIAKRFQTVEEKGLEKIFQNIDLFEKSVYKDTSVINSLSNSALIGIFSQGDENFQKKKILFIKKVLDDENVYIFHDKLAQAKDVFSKYRDCEIFLVDDNLELLRKIKSIFPNISEVFIDRGGKYGDNRDITRIKSLSELRQLIYD